MFLVDKRQFGRRAAIISIGAAFLAAGTFSPNYSRRGAKEAVSLD